MTYLGRALSSVIFSRISGVASLPSSSRVVSVCRRQAIFRQLRNSSVALNCRKTGVGINMADSESKELPNTAGSVEGERTGEEEAKLSNKLAEEKEGGEREKDTPGNTESQWEVIEVAKEEGVSGLATSEVETDDNKEKDVEVVSELSGGSTEGKGNEEPPKADTEVTTSTEPATGGDSGSCHDDELSKEDNTPPPEEDGHDGQPVGTIDDTSQAKSVPQQVGTNPPRQGGFGSFFTSQVASMRRWFSQEPKRGK